MQIETLICQLNRSVLLVIHTIKQNGYDMYHLFTIYEELDFFSTEYIRVFDTIHTISRNYFPNHHEHTAPWQWRRRLTLYIPEMRVKPDHRTTTLRHFFQLAHNYHESRTSTAVSIRTVPTGVPNNTVMQLVNFLHKG
jgi:hypothetical protein